MQWLDTKMQKHIDKVKGFKTTKDGHMEKADFFKVYDLIECLVVVNCKELRDTHDGERLKLFKAAVADGASDDDVKAYINKFQDDLNTQ